MHDKEGNPIKVGDRVILEGTVKETYSSDTDCNVQVQITEEGEPGPYNVTSYATVNAKQLKLINTVTDKNGQPESEEEGMAHSL